MKFPLDKNFFGENNNSVAFSRSIIFENLKQNQIKISFQPFFKKSVPYSDTFLCFLLSYEFKSFVTVSRCLDSHHFPVQHGRDCNVIRFQFSGKVTSGWIRSSHHSQHFSR